ncbi:MAG: PQQ-binding-like beta-propeller repeat protein, partial [Chitinophagaceae bacterium]
IWRFHSPANVISTPALVNGKVVFGNQNGTVQALNLLSGKKEWAYQTRGPIFSTPASTTNQLILGSADGNVYSFTDAGKKTWTYVTAAAVLGSPVIENNVAYIGGSDGCFQALTASTGKAIWKYCSLEGPVTGTPLVYGETVIFGAWDRNLYALNKKTGVLIWKWNNGSPVINYSPAACTPVVSDGVVYIVAPDRYLSAIDATTGSTLWRTGESKVRESLGISEDGQVVFGKTMQDSVVAFRTNRQSAKEAWKFNVGFGYEHVPSMLVEKEGRQFFGTKNGVVYCIDGARGKISWSHKVDNSMVNTVRVLNSKQILVSTMDGTVVLLEEH